jgi:hypothetical protein
LLTNFKGWSQRFFEVSTIDSASVKVWAVDKPEDADLLVYFVYEAKDVTKVGYWMEVATPKEAQVLLIFVDDENLANLRICLVDYPEQAGWRNEKKKDLLKLK